MNNSPEWYDYIDSQVIKFQAGDTACGEELIKIFQPFFLKYIALIKEGKINFNDRDTRKFIALFIDGDTGKKLGGRKLQSGEVKATAYRTAAYLHKSCELIEVEEIRQEIYLAFFTLTNRWVKKGVKTNFCGYMYNCFRYELGRALTTLIKDPLVNNIYLNIRYYDDENNPEYVDILDTINTDSTIYLEIEDGIDTNWIRGLTCSEEFLSLTALQRLILKEYYYDDYSDKAIASKTGLHINTVFRNRTKAVQKLRELYVEEC